jgi:hypothetical protein
VATFGRFALKGIALAAPAGPQQPEWQHAQ